MKNPPQFELPTAETVFNLVLEDAVDGERVRQEMEAAADEARLAKLIEQKQQPALL